MEKGVVMPRVTTLKSSLSPLFLESSSAFPQLISNTFFAGGCGELRARETEWVEQWGADTQMDNGTAGPICLLAWQPILS